MKEFFDFAKDAPFLTFFLVLVVGSTISECFEAIASIWKN